MINCILNLIILNRLLQDKYNWNIRNYTFNRHFKCFKILMLMFPDLLENGSVNVTGLGFTNTKFSAFPVVIHSSYKHSW